MSTQVAARPAPLSRVWSGDKIVAEDLTGDDLSDVLQLHSDASAWWILPRGEQYGEAELRSVAHALDLDHLALRDLLAEDRRAKFDTVGQARIVITNAVSFDREKAELLVQPVSIIATDRAMICLATATAAFGPARLLASKQDLLARGGVDSALQIVLTSVISGYEDAVEWLEDESDALAEALFDERPLYKEEQLHAFRLRSALSQLRRLTEPMRTVMTDILANPPTDAKGKAVKGRDVTRHWDVISEQQTRAANAADALREALSSVFDTSLALADLRMNQIMKKLTGWAAIVAVPTLVTGFAGMNVQFPLDGTGVGFWVYFLIMVVSIAILYVLFRRKDWL